PFFFKLNPLKNEWLLGSTINLATELLPILLRRNDIFVGKAEPGESAFAVSSENGTRQSFDAGRWSSNISMTGNSIIGHCTPNVIEFSPGHPLAIVRDAKLPLV